MPFFVSSTPAAHEESNSARRKSSWSRPHCMLLRHWVQGNELRLRLRHQTVNLFSFTAAPETPVRWISSTKHVEATDTPFLVPFSCPPDPDLELYAP